MSLLLFTSACTGTPTSTDSQSGTDDAATSAASELSRTASSSTAQTEDAAAAAESESLADVADPERPVILSVSGEPAVANLDRFDLAVEMDAVYDNPYDQREVALDAVFSGPDGSVWSVPGFFDARDTWRFRFTPSLEGTWTYVVTVTDVHGASEPAGGTFESTHSDAKGWIWPADWVDEDLSPHYFAHLDGTPWLGLGHADLGMGFGGFTGSTFKKMKEMGETGENFEMWWPFWTFNFIQNSYDNYQPAQVELIDLVMAEAEANDIQIAYTIWNHQLLRTNKHRWGRGLWTSNGFGQLVEIDEFFTDDESWAWQENLYRYTIARWGYSTSIAMWQTVTEINGTESYEHTDDWHADVNQYFIDNDPYRHPTSATKSGGEYWPSAYELMDVPQMHVYEQFHQNPVQAAKIMADWTQLMWEAEAKPNWIGEYGERSGRSYPEFFHNASWATLAAGAAIGPIEWNDKNSYGKFDDKMVADQSRISGFMNQLQMASLSPEQLEISSETSDIRGWGVAGVDGGFVWIQDFTLEATTFGVEEDIDAIRNRPQRNNVVVELGGLPDGSYLVTPYNTWTGEWLSVIEVDCSIACNVALPAFTHDVALQIVRA